MGLGMAAVQNTLELYNLGYLKNLKSIIEMGSQELHVHKEDLKTFFDNAGIENDLINTIPNINNWPGGPRSSSKHFYSLLGIKEYQCIDINGEHDCITHDLNKPLSDKSKFKKFDIVTDHGTCDCIYNVGECYKTIHNLTKSGGYIIIHQRAFKAFRYYLFDKSFMETIAAANNYKIVFNSYTIMPSSGSTSLAARRYISEAVKTANGTGYEFHIPATRSLFNTLDLPKLASVGIYIVFQKQNDNDFKIPDFYHFEKENNSFSKFNRMYFKDPLSYSYIPSATLNVEVTSSLLLIKTLLKRFINKIKRIIKI